MRKTLASGHLLPLEKRMSEARQIRREERQSRRAVRALAIEQGHIRLGLAQFFNRGFFRRMWWVLTGR